MHQLLQRITLLCTDKCQLLRLLLKHKWIRIGSGNVMATVVWERSRLLIRCGYWLSPPRRSLKCQLLCREVTCVRKTTWVFDGTQCYLFISLCTLKWPWRHSHVVLHKKMCLSAHMLVLSQSWLWEEDRLWSVCFKLENCLIPCFVDVHLVPDPPEIVSMGYPLSIFQPSCSNALKITHYGMKL